MENKVPGGGYKFHLIDYLVFGAMLVFSASVGVYFGYFNKSKSKRQKPTERHPDETFTDKKSTDFGSKSMLEYLLGSRKLKSFPVAMSLVASYISGVTVLGTPAEIYNFGSQYWLIVFPILLMGFIVSFVYLPVFCSLKVGSSYEVRSKSNYLGLKGNNNFLLFHLKYLELRFNQHVRTIASVMFVIDEVSINKRTFCHNLEIAFLSSMVTRYKTICFIILGTWFEPRSLVLFLSLYFFNKNPNLP